MIDNGSSLAIESRDMMGDELMGLVQSSFLTEDIYGMRNAYRCLYIQPL
jgi:hypothetical protein